MNDSHIKINYLKWFKMMGIKYYFTNQFKDEFFLPKTENIVTTKLTKLDPSIGFDVVDSEIGCIDNTIRQARMLADAASSLEELKKYVINFDGCELKKFATNVVFGDGNKDSDIMLIGEAPGVTEDKIGIPFCGESGILLDNLLKSIGISRNKNAYITNTVFWRPPANRTPTQEEVDICRPFVEKHIALINPKIIILVGNTAVTSLLGKNSAISKIRQEYYLYSNKYLTKPITTTSIFHPAYLLRQPSQKKVTWFDLIKIQQYILQSF